jgi:integrase
MGHIYKRAKGTWTVIYDLPRGPDGKRRQKSKAVQGTKSDARRELSLIEHGIRTGEYVEPSRITVDGYLSRWLDECASSLSPKTIQEYHRIARNHIVPALGSLSLQQLRPLEIQSYYTIALKSGRLDGKGGLSPQTVRHHHALLHKALDQAVKWQLLSRNPVDGVQPPRVHRLEMATLEEKDMAVLLKASRETDLYIPTLIAATTGLRRGEILGLKWKDLDFEHQLLAVKRSLEHTREGLRFKEPKTHRSRRPVRIPEAALKALKVHKASEKLRLGPDFSSDQVVCLRKDGTLWPPDLLSRRFTDLVRRLDIPPVRFHDLRHAFATMSLRYGVNPKIVSEMLGHSGVQITLDTYSHVLPDMQAVAVTRIDEVLARVLGQRTK